LFYQRLAAAPLAANAEEAMRLVCQLIEQVEDEHCPLPREEPPPRRFTGRMYAPRPDRITPLPEGGLFAEARHHFIHCHADGGIEIIQARENRIELKKAGKSQ
jgi:hypothetical protein